VNQGAVASNNQKGWPWWMRIQQFVQQRRAAMAGREEEESDVEIDGMEL